MGIALQIVTIILIVGAVIMSRKKYSRNAMITKSQKALAVFQIVPKTVGFGLLFQVSQFGGGGFNAQGNAKLLDLGEQSLGLQAVFVVLYHINSP